MPTSKPLTKVVFVLPSLKAGGAERVISHLSSKMDKEIFLVTLIILGFEKDSVYNTTGVNIVYLERGRLLKAAPSLFNSLKKIKPHIVMSSIGHVNIMMGLFSIFFRRIKFVGREASVISSMSKFSTKKWLLPKSVTRFLYNKLDAVVCQSSDMFHDFIKIYGFPKERMHIIHNPAPEKIEVERTSSNSNRRLITVGRLSAEKGHERLLHILSAVNFDFTYTMVGSGNQELKIKALAKELNIIDKIDFVDHTQDVNKYLSTHDVFMQGSYVEGFPNALMESCAVGTPVIAFNAPGGTKEIVENGVNGYLANSEAEFKKYLEKMVDESWEVNAIMESIYRKFDSKYIVQKYQNLFTSLLFSK